MSDGSKVNKATLPPVQVDPELRTRLMKIAESEDRTLTYIIRKALQEYVEHHQETEE